MTPEESNLINGLFQRLRSSDSVAKDPQALQAIQSQVSALPSAPYLLVQTVLVQEQALKGAQAQIAQLQSQLAQANQGGAKPQGFLSGLLHPRPAAPTAPPLPAAPPQQVPQAPPAAYAPQAGYAAPQPAGGGGGGFLKGALSTAAGVAGGALLFQGIENLLGHNAGPFGSVMGGGYGGGFGGGGFGGPPTENVEVINNTYYQNDNNTTFLPPQDPQNDDITDDNDQYQDQDQNIDDSQLADADSGYDDSGFDNSGGDDSGGGGDYA